MAAQSRVKRFAKHLLVEDDDEQGAEGPLEEEETEETEETSFEEESEESEDDEPMTIARYLAEKAEQSAVEVYTRMESFHTLHVRRDQRRVLIEMERATMGDLFFHSLTLTGNEGSLPDMFNETPSNAGLHFVVAPNGTDIWLAEAQPAGSPSDFAAPVYDASSGGLQSGFRRSYRPLVDDVENGTVLLDITQWLLGFSKYVTKEGGGHRHSGVTLAETPPPPAPPAAPTEPTKKPKKIVKKKRKPTPMPGGQNGESVVLVEARTFPKNFLLRIAVQQQGGFGSPMRPQERAPSSSSVSSSRLRRPRRGAQHTCRGGACCGISLRSEETGLDQLDAVDQRNGGNAMFGFGGPPPSGTAYFTASFGLLPKIPMTPRVWDRRVGYFLNDVRIGGPRDVTKDMKVIHRWSLERNPWVEEEEEEDTIKRTAPPLSTSSEDAAGGVDDTADAAAVLPPSPLPPRSRLDASAHGCISYYIDPHVPPLFHGTIKQGVLAWNAAFAKAGRFGPSGSGVMRCFAPGDPGWPSDYALGDLRYNSIFMTNPAMAGLYGYGPSVVDYRSGEILVGSVLLGFDAFVQFTASHNLDQLNRVRSKQFEAFNMSPLLPVDHPDVHRKVMYSSLCVLSPRLTPPSPSSSSSSLCLSLLPRVIFCSRFSATGEVRSCPAFFFPLDHTTRATTLTNAHSFLHTHTHTHTHSSSSRRSTKLDTTSDCVTTFFPLQKGTPQSWTIPMQMIRQTQVLQLWEATSFPHRAFMTSTRFAMATPASSVRYAVHATTDLKRLRAGTISARSYRRHWEAATSTGSSSSRQSIRSSGQMATRTVVSIRASTHTITTCT